MRWSETFEMAEFTSSKHELFSVLVVPVDKSKPWAIFGGSKTISGGVRQSYGISEKDGRWYGYYGGMTGVFSAAKGGETLFTSGAPDLYRVDLANGDTNRIAERIDGYTYRDWLVDGQGKVAATLDFDTRNGAWTIRNADFKVIRQGTNPRGGIDMISLSRTTDSLIYSQEDEETGAEMLYEIPLAGGDPTQLLTDISTIRRFIDPRTHRIMGYEVDQDSPQANFFDPRLDKRMRGVERAFPGLNVRLKDWNESFDRLILSTDGNGDAGTWWLVDLKTGQATDLGASYPIPPKEVGPIRTLEYKAADGLAMSAVLTLPPGRKADALPVIVLPHGGPGDRDYPEFHWWAQALASRGYAVLQPNFRGSTGFGSAFEMAGHGQWGRKQQSDISDGLAELVRQGIADPKRACIMGRSYGGYAALAGVTLQQGLYRCAVSLAGVSDLTRYYRQRIAESGNNATRIRSLREYIGNPNDLDSVSPVKFAARADAPILLIHGKDDVVVDIDQRHLMENALRAAGKSVEFVALKNEDHWLSRSDTRQFLLESAVAFIEKHNPPDPPPGSE